MARPHLRLLVLALGAFAVGTDLFVVAGILPGVAGDLGTSVAAAGQLVTVFAVTYGVTSPLLAVATGRAGRRGLLAIALAAFAAANVLAASAPSLWVVLLARASAAAAAGLFMPAASALAASMVPPEQRGRALATVIGGLSVAQVLGVPLGIAVGNLASWRATFVLVAGLGGLAALGVAVLLPVIPAQQVASLAVRLRVARRPAVLAVLALTALGLAAGFANFTYQAPVVRLTFGLGPPALAPLTFVFGLAAVGGSFLGGWMADRFGGGRAVLAALSGVAAGQVLVAVAASLAPVASPAVVRPVAAVGFLVGAWLGSGFIPAQQHRLLTRVPEAAPVAIALNSMAIYAGLTVAAVAGGVALSIGAAAAVTRTAAVLAVAAFVLGLLLLRPSPASVPEPAAELQRVDQRQ